MDIVDAPLATDATVIVDAHAIELVTRSRYLALVNRVMLKGKPLAPAMEYVTVIRLVLVMEGAIVKEDHAPAIKQDMDTNAHVKSLILVVRPITGADDTITEKGGSIIWLI